VTSDRPRGRLRAGFALLKESSVLPDLASRYILGLPDSSALRGFLSMKYPKSAIKPMPVLTFVLGLAVFTNVAFATTTPVVMVTSPTNGSQDGSPVNFTASASSPDCSAGIAAMRIYTAPGDGAYTTDSDSLNVNLSLAPGTYNTVVQAWDNCGGVGKTPVDITVTSTALPPPKFLYASDYSGGLIHEYNVNPTTGVISATSQVSVATGSEPEALSTDKGGFRLYAVSQKPTQVAGFFINRDDGGLQQVPGAPQAVSGYPFSVVVHPSGDYIYVPVVVTQNDNVIYAFAVQANGSLAPVPGSPFPTNFPSPDINAAMVTGAAIDPTGSFLYATAYGSSYVNAYTINKANGALTPVSGEPYFLVGDTAQGGANAVAFAQGGQHLVVPGWWDANVTVYNVNPSTGALANAPGSPIPLPKAEDGNLISIAIDPLDRWWYLYDSNFCDLCTLPGGMSIFTLTAKDTAEVAVNEQNCGDIVVADPSGKFVYAIGNTEENPGCGVSPGAILGFSVNQSNGAMTPLPGSPFPSPVLDGGVGGDGLVVTQ
jgi:6-phosphogluconolactonase